ncbi:MAG: tetratricopeptide repeat protein, partial [Elusimicrobiota bacterium]
MQKIISFVSRETTRVIHTECLPHNKVIPFFPWINILKDILDITGDAPASGFKKKVLRYSDRESARWLGEVMGISIEERAQEEFAGEQRKNKILKSFMNVISGCAKLKKALILILDDLHWFDDLSIELLFEFLKKFPPKNILLITTSRQTYIFSESPKNIINISLKPFTKNETSELIKKELPGSLFKDGIIEDIFKKSEGNPFFISEMVKTLKESRPLPEYLDVPGNIEQILMGRLDKLNVEAKDILKVASVIGVTFDMHLLKELLLYLKLGRIPVSVCIKNLRDTDFIDCLSRAGLSVYAFKHIMIQETVYNTLSYKVRRYLHRQIAQWYKKRFGPEIEKYYEIIATHFERANSTVSALKYLHLSYEKSMKVYANRTALDFLSRAEKIITRNHRHYNSEKKNALTGIYENKGLLYIQLGRYNSAIQNFKDMQYWSCKNNDRIKFAYSMNLMGSCYRHLGAHKKALSFCLECLAAGRKLKNNDLISSALTSINVIHWYTGNYRKAIDAGEEALNLRRNQGDLTAVSRGLFGLGNSYIKIGEIEPAHRYFSELRSISKKLNEKMGLAYALEGLGYCCMWKGNTRRALSLFEKSLLLRTRIEFYRGMAYSYLDIGSVYFEEGRFKFAEENFKKALEILKEIEDKNLKSDILRNLGLIELIKGRTEFAKKYIFEAYKIALETKFYESKVKTIDSLCIYYLSLRRFKKAEYFCNKLFACGVKDRLKEIFYKGLIL